MIFNLLGYFAGNFGDDYMLKIIVNSLPEMEFVVDEQNDVSKVLLEEANVRTGKKSEILKYPKLSVIGSGFMINNNKALIIALKRFFKKEWLSDYCLGCNIEPIKSLLGRLLIKKRLENFKLIVCRDKKSYAWLKKNVKTRIEYLPDILFSIPEEWLFKAEKKDKLGISVMNIGDDDTAFNYYRAMAEISDFYIEKTGRCVYLLAFSVGLEDDFKACEKVRNLAENQEKIKIISHGNNGEILKAYAECEKIIATRFHSAVLALKTKTAMFPIIYREKMQNLLDDTGYDIKGFSISAINVEVMKEFIEEKQDFKLGENFLKPQKSHAEVLKDELQKYKT